MQGIYTPKGKALEYGDYACNLYKGCGHGCTYCYAAMMAKRFGNNEFFTNPQPRTGIIEQLEKDAKKLKAQWAASQNRHLEVVRETEVIPDDISCPKSIPIPFVFLCFSTDPYQPINQEHQLTRQAIEVLHGYGLGVNILTKGIITDFDLLAKSACLSKVGITLTGYSDIRLYEKETAHNYDRAFNIKKAKSCGIYTWISFEPVIDPGSVLEAIKYSKNNDEIWPDEIKIGKWNYSPEAKKIDWHRFVNEAIELCERLGVKYYIKEDLKKYINKET